MQGIHISAVFCNIFNDGEHLQGSSHHRVSWWLTAVIIYFFIFHQSQAKCWLFPPSALKDKQQLFLAHFLFREKKRISTDVFPVETLTLSHSSTHASLFYFYFFYI